MPKRNMKLPRIHMSGQLGVGNAPSKQGSQTAAFLPHLRIQEGVDGEPLDSRLRPSFQRRHDYVVEAATCVVDAKIDTTMAIVGYEDEVRRTSLVFGNGPRQLDPQDLDVAFEGGYESRTQQS